MRMSVVSYLLLSVVALSFVGCTGVVKRDSGREGGQCTAQQLFREQNMLYQADSHTKRAKTAFEERQFDKMWHHLELAITILEWIECLDVDPEIRKLKYMKRITISDRVFEELGIR